MDDIVERNLVIQGLLHGLMRAGGVPFGDAVPCTWLHHNKQTTCRIKCDRIDVVFPDPEQILCCLEKHICLKGVLQIQKVNESNKTRCTFTHTYGSLQNGNREICIDVYIHTVESAMSHIYYMIPMDKVLVALCSDHKVDFKFYGLSRDMKKDLNNLCIRINPLPSYTNIPEGLYPWLFSELYRRKCNGWKLLLSFTVQEHSIKLPDESIVSFENIQVDKQGFIETSCGSWPTFTSNDWETFLVDDSEDEELAVLFSSESGSGSDN